MKRMSALGATIVALTAMLTLSGCSKPNASASCKDWGKFSTSDKKTAAEDLVKQKEGSASTGKVVVAVGSITLYCKLATDSSPIANVYNGNALTGG